ncbi:MAG TPA: redoxin family protein [bacterium]|nr:redoxin family protein [bacterium]
MRRFFLFLVLLALAGGCGSKGDQVGLTPADKRVAAPEISGYFLNVAGPMSLAQLKGKVVLLNFWATWCGPCRAEIPSLVKLYSLYHPKGVEFLSLSVEIDNNLPRGQLDQFLASNNINYPTGLASHQTLSDYSTDGIPANFFIDKQGRLATYFIGLRSEDDLTAVLDQLLKEP